ncbi:MAG: hypothetical protein FJ316_10745 [SAR202 cluster bacterium]|nr:hypothetical protein [SAR202 cluster bacterium]
MLRFSLVSNVCLILVSLIALVLGSGIALAHERRDVGKYQFVVGFIAEPAFEGQKNGVDLRVTNKETTQPIEGLEKTLQVEITHIGSNTSKTFPIRTMFRDPGHYTNDLIFTAPGQYKFRFFGDIKGTPVNETFESGPGRFNDMQSSADLQFPQKLPETREVEEAARGAQSTAQQAQSAAQQAGSRASSANTLAILGIILGAVGIASGVGGMAVGMRKR